MSFPCVLRRVLRLGDGESSGESCGESSATGLPIAFAFLQAVQDPFGESWGCFRQRSKRPVMRTGGGAPSGCRHFFVHLLGCYGNSSYLCSMNIKQEFGKWFLDVAKYVITAMLLSSLIEGLSQPWLLTTAVSVTILCLIFGALLMSKGKEEEDRKIRNRERLRNKTKNGGK